MLTTYATWEPGHPLQFRQWTHRQVEALVGGRMQATAGAQLWRRPELRLKLMASDVGLLFPDDYPEHGPEASRFVAALGGPEQPWAGPLAVYAIDSAEGGFPVEMNGEQRAAIEAAYRAAGGPVRLPQ